MVCYVALLRAGCPGTHEMAVLSMQLIQERRNLQGLGQLSAHLASRPGAPLAVAARAPTLQQAAEVIRAALGATGGSAAALLGPSAGGPAAAAAAAAVAAMFPPPAAGAAGGGGGGGAAAARQHSPQVAHSGEASRAASGETQGRAPPPLGIVQQQHEQPLSRSASPGLPVPAQPQGRPVQGGVASWQRQALHPAVTFASRSAASEGGGAAPGTWPMAGSSEHAQHQALMAMLGSQEQRAAAGSPGGAQQQQAGAGLQQPPLAAAAGGAQGLPGGLMEFHVALGGVTLRTSEPEAGLQQAWPAEQQRLQQQQQQQPQAGEGWDAAAPGESGGRPPAHAARTRITLGPRLGSGGTSGHTAVSTPSSTGAGPRSVVAGSLMELGGQGQGATAAPSPRGGLPARGAAAAASQHHQPTPDELLALLHQHVTGIGGDGGAAAMDTDVGIWQPGQDLPGTQGAFGAPCQQCKPGRSLLV